MADPQRSEQQYARPASSEPPKRSFMSRMTGAVAAHASMALAAIAVLAVMLVATIVYYRGLLFLGPYAGRAGFAAGATAAAGAAPPAAAKGDPETERLIDSINKA
jgi:hypothetical protein